MTLAVEVVAGVAVVVMMEEVTVVILRSDCLAITEPRDPFRR